MADADPASHPTGEREPVSVWWPCGRAAELLRPRERIIPVLGAGISSLPSSGLADWIRGTFPCRRGDWSEIPSKSLWATVDEVDLDHLSRDEVLARIAAHIAGISGEPGARERALVRVPSNFVITFNYDLLLRDALLEAGYSRGDVNVLTQLELAEAFDLALKPPGTIPPTILHLHGCVDRPETLVLDGEGYRDLKARPFLDELIAVLVRKYTLCFLGTQLDEPYLLERIGNYLGEDSPHLMMCKKETADDLRGGRAPVSASRHGIHFATYEEHADLELFLAAFVRDERPEVPKAPELPGVAAGVPEYVAAEVRPARSEDDPATETFAALLAFSRPETAPLSEADLATRHRDVIVGAPGTGKTELLRAIAKQTPPGERAVLFGAPAIVGIQLQEARELLLAWAQAGESAPSGESMNREALATRRFHFLVDSFDEVPAALQDSFVARVRDLADAFPQHAFTVAGRPVEALSALSDAGWTRLELRPGESWQRRYLESADVSLEALLAAMPSLRDLRELLVVPFFLVRIVELHKRGGLANSTDMLGLLQSLIDDLLGRETGLPLASEGVREWMQRVALAMTVAEKEGVSLGEAAEVPLPGGILGSHEQVVTSLVERLMLEERAGTYGFPHRLFREALAAERLIAIGPSDELLDILAPVLEPGVSGIRQRWLVPLALVLPRSPEWRRAIQVRDPIAAARGVPLNANESERETAARLLWETYREWGIWIWDHFSPMLANDGEALARLLRSGLPTVLEEVWAGLDHRLPQVQGNAVRVLSVAGEEIEQELRRILEDPEREPAVRQEAAAAAQRLRATSLLVAIVSAAVRAEDRFEQEDLTRVALELAPAERVVETARALLGTRRTREALVSAAVARVKGAALVQILRAVAEFDDDSIDASPYVLARALESLEGDDLTQDVVRDVAFLAARWGARSGVLVPVLSGSPVAALEGFAAACGVDPGRWWNVAQFSALFEADSLESAGAPSWMVESRRATPPPEAPRVGSAPERRSLGPDADGPRADADKSDPTLSEALSESGSGWDLVIMRMAEHFAREVGELAPDERRELERRLRAWWPEPFQDSVRKTGENRWMLSNEAAAWMFYGPALDLELEPREWMQIASCGFLFDDQLHWLRRRCPDGAADAVATGCRVTDARSWSQVLEATPGQVQDGVVTALLARISPREDDDEWAVATIGRRLAEGGHEDAVGKLAGRNSRWSSTLSPVRAGAGDLDEQSALLEAALEVARGGELPNLERLEWLPRAKSAKILPVLFELVQLAGGRPEPSGGFVGHSWGDLARLLRAAIREIDTVEAVRGYEELIRSDERWRFMRLEREEVLQVAIERHVSDEDPRLAELLDVPHLAP